MNDVVFNELVYMVLFLDQVGTFPEEGEHPPRDYTIATTKKCISLVVISVHMVVIPYSAILYEPY